MALRPNDETGFTLIETVVAAAVLITTLAGIAQLFVRSTQAAMAARRAPVALGLATSTTQPSTPTMPTCEGTIGAAESSLRSLPASAPHATSARALAAITAQVGADTRRTVTARISPASARAARGESGGSAFSPR